MNEGLEMYLMNFGALGYTCSQMLLVLQSNGIVCDDLESEMAKSDSLYRQKYEQGAARSRYEIDLRLHDLALSGDIKAIEKLEQRKRMNGKEK